MIVSQVQVLALQAQGAEFNAQSSQKKPGVVLHICNPSAEAAHIEGSVSGACQPGSLAELVSSRWSTRPDQAALLFLPV